MRNYKENPCYMCDLRKQECHSTCTIYKEWKDKMTALNEEAYKNKEEFYRNIFPFKRKRL